MKNELAYNETLKKMLQNLKEAALEAQRIGATDAAHSLFSRAKDLEDLTKKKGL